MENPAIASSRRVAVVTGSSSGFGMYGSVELARAGFRVFATMRNPAKREGLDAEAARAGVTVEVVQLDVTSDESVDQAFGRIGTVAGPVDVLVSNAGYGIGGFVEDLSLQEIREQFETNFFGGIRVTKAVLPSMRKRRTGRIILVSSIGALNPVPALSAYNATKAALEAFGEALYYEVKRDGVAVSMLEPGTYATDIFYDNKQIAAAAQDPASPHYEQSQRLERFVMKNVVARSKSHPREVGRAIVKAATARRPKLRYPVGRDARPTKVVRTLMPPQAVEAVFRRVMRG